MSEMTLEERLARVEAYLGLGDSEAAEATRTKAKRDAVEFHKMMFPYLPASSAGLVRDHGPSKFSDLLRERN
jgi:3-methyladenine DNA glycosylase Mpg